MKLTLTIDVDDPEGLDPFGEYVGKVLLRKVEAATKPKPKPRVMASRSANDLHDQFKTYLEYVHPGTRTYAGWPKEFDRLLRQRNVVEIQQAIGWLMANNERRETPFVVLSPSSLREKFDRIRVAMKSKGGKYNGSRGTPGHSERTNRPRRQKSDPESIGDLLDGN